LTLSQTFGERWIEEGQMAVLKPGTTVSLRADAAARVMLPWRAKASKVRRAFSGGGAAGFM